MSKKTEQEIVAELARNPFASRGPSGWVPVCYAWDSTSRIYIVKRLGAEDIRKVLALNDLQKGVREVAERRLRKLERINKAVQDYKGALD